MIGCLPWQTCRRLGTPLCHRIICRGGSCQEHRGIMILVAAHLRPVGWLTYSRTGGSNNPRLFMFVNGTTDVIDSRTKICYNPPHSPTGRKGGLFLWQDMSGTWTRRSDGFTAFRTSKLLKQRIDRFEPIGGVKNGGSTRTVFVTGDESLSMMV